MAYDDGLLVPRDHAYLLRILSWGATLPGTIGILSGKPGLGSAVYFGSIVAQNYWSEPRYSWYRNLDIGTVLTLIVLHWWWAFTAGATWLFYALQITGVGFYGLSWYFQLSGDVWSATLSHATVHVLANTSVVLLYLST